jgi:hypothetical protein
MKKIISPLVFLLFACIVSLSFTVAPSLSKQKVGPVNHDSIPPNFFLPDSFLVNYNLQLKSDANPNMRVWKNPLKGSQIFILNDIRLGFKNEKKAVAFLKKNLAENSENGIEIQTGIKIPGTQELRIFRENDKVALANNKAGYNVRCYFFLFVVDYVYVKIFLTTDSKTTVEEASVFAQEAARDLHLALGK